MSRTGIPYTLIINVLFFYNYCYYYVYYCIIIISFSIERPRERRRRTDFSRRRRHSDLHPDDVCTGTPVVRPSSTSAHRLLHHLLLSGPRGTRSRGCLPSSSLLVSPGPWVPGGREWGGWGSLQTRAHGHKISRVYRRSTGEIVNVQTSGPRGLAPHRHWCDRRTSPVQSPRVRTDESHDRRSTPTVRTGPTLTGESKAE